jgi:hypothetical protein
VSIGGGAANSLESYTRPEPVLGVAQAPVLATREITLGSGLDRHRVAHRCPVEAAARFKYETSSWLTAGPPGFRLAGSPPLSAVCRVSRFPQSGSFDRTED